MHVPSPLLDAYHYAKKQFAETVCPDCIKGLTPSIADGRVSVRHECPATGKRTTLFRADGLARVELEVHRLDYLDETTFPAFHRSQVFHTERICALTYRTKINLQNGRGYTGNGNCSMIIDIHTPLHRPQSFQLLNTAIYSLRDAFLTAATCRLTAKSGRDLPNLQFRMGLYMGTREAAMRLPLLGIGDMAYTFPAEDLGHMSQLDMSSMIANTAPFRHLVAIGNAIDSETIAIGGV